MIAIGEVLAKWKLVVAKRVQKGGETEMKSVNILIGNVTWNPELKQTENDKAVCSFGLAILEPSTL
jgi:hypothetical protein